MLLLISLLEQVDAIFVESAIKGSQIATNAISQRRAHLAILPPDERMLERGLRQDPVPVPQRLGKRGHQPSLRLGMGSTTEGVRPESQPAREPKPTRDQLPRLSGSLPHMARRLEFEGHIAPTTKSTRPERNEPGLEIDMFPSAAAAGSISSIRVDQGCPFHTEYLGWPGNNWDGRRSDDHTQNALYCCTRCETLEGFAAR